MTTEHAPVVFFDIGDTLGIVRFSEGNAQIERIDVFPFVPGVLVSLVDMGSRLGIISNRGNCSEGEVNRAIQEAGIYDYFEPALIIYGPKDSVDIFVDAADKAGHGGTHERCIFVGENASERAFASAAGFHVADHPATQVLSDIIGKQFPELLVRHNILDAN